jgi:hypothetical protein
MLVSVTDSFQVLRWRPVAAGGIPHVLVQGRILLLLVAKQKRKHITKTAADDEYEGYHFPAGTTFLANAWYGLYIHFKYHLIFTAVQSR